MELEIVPRPRDLICAWGSPYLWWRLKNCNFALFCRGKEGHSLPSLLFDDAVETSTKAMSGSVSKSLIASIEINEPSIEHLFWWSNSRRGDVYYLREAFRCPDDDFSAHGLWLFTYLPCRALNQTLCSWFSPADLLVWLQVNSWHVGNGWLLVCRLRLIIIFLLSTLLGERCLMIDIAQAARLSIALTILFLCKFVQVSNRVPDSNSLSGAELILILGIIASTHC